MRLRHLGFLLASLSALGCSQEMPPERFATTRVTGRVHIGSRPLDGGWVEFHPIDGAVGLLRSGPLRAQGRFSVEGVGLGPHVIRIVDPPFPLPPASPDPRIGFEQFTSPIRRVIRPNASLDIDLLAERVRLASRG